MKKYYVLFVVFLFSLMIPTSVFAENIQDPIKPNVFQVVENNKVFDVFYEVKNGSIDEITINSHTVSFEIRESENTVVYFHIPNAMLRTSETCHWGFSTLLDPMGGQPIDFKTEPSKSTLLSDSGYNEVIVRYSGDPALISLQFSTMMIFEGVEYYPHCQKPLQWIKQDAILWSNNLVSDSHFGSLIQLMIEHKLLNLPITFIEEIGDPPFSVLYADKITHIPSWLKESAKWWAQEKVSDGEFLNNLEYLINSNIIKFEKKDNG